MQQSILFVCICFALVAQAQNSQTKTSTRIFCSNTQRWADLNWQNVASDDNKYISTKKLISGTSYPIEFIGFGFTIPADATIQKIEAKIIRFKSGKNNVKDQFCTLVTGTGDYEHGGAFPNVANTSFWTTKETSVSYSFPTSGTTTNSLPYQWTPEMINAPYFGIFYDIAFSTGGSGAIAYIEKVEVTVTYSSSTKSSAATVNDNTPFEKGIFDVKTFSNPTTSDFKIVTQTNSPEPVNVRIIDAYGRLVELHNRIIPNTMMQFGTSYKQGIYFLEMIQGNKRKTIKLVKN